MDLAAHYAERLSSVLDPLAERLEEYLDDIFGKMPRVDAVTTRAKSLDRFLAKAAKLNADGSPKYSDPINQIQDQIGARIITFYLDDVKKLAEEVAGYFRAIETQDMVPDSEAEFGYFGKHFMLLLPVDVFDDRITEKDSPKFFELQIKTLFQHAWAEANHDLGYKPEAPLSNEQKRCLAYTSAQAWGADRMFDDLHRQTNGETTNC